MAVQSARAAGNFFARFWRGDYSLPFSYWVIGFLGNIAIGLLVVVLSAAVPRDDFNPYVLGAYILAIWLLVMGWGVFHIVGVWRSANRYRDEKRQQNKPAAWAAVAQVLLVLGAIRLGVEFIRSGLPQLREAADIALRNDPQIPGYKIRVMRNGSEMEIAGGLKYGLASDADKVLAASPQVRVVHLNSIGGRVGEAKKLGALIRKRGLSTYTSTECLSACTIAFAAGRDRWLKEGGKLGFHTASFAGEDMPNVMRTDLIEAGYDPAFVSRAISYASGKMWFPTVSELQSAKVITGVADGYKFAASGYGIDATNENFAKELRRESVFQAVEQADPKAFAAIAAEFQRRYVEGVPEGTIIDDIRSQKMLPLIRSRLPTADDRTLIDFVILVADQYDALGAKDPEACYRYSLQGADTKTLAMLSPQLRDRELALSERILRSAQVQRSPTKAHLQSLYEVLFRRMISKYGNRDPRLVLEPAKVQLPEYRTYCRMASATFREISIFPPAEAGVLIGEMFKEASGTK